MPFLFDRGVDGKDWNKILLDLLHLIPFLFVFLINVYILVPKLLFLKKYKSYILYLAIVIFIGVGISFIPTLYNTSPQKTMAHEESKLRPEFNKPPQVIFIDNIIILVLIVGAGTSSKLITKWLSEEKLRKDIEKEQLKTNLALLRHQVSPHFFMNTLNNIHALIDINTEDAKDAIIRLSTLMRYLLYDSAQSEINLKKEIEFIHSFIELMKLRFSNKVEISITLPDKIPDIRIPPMLFITFLENAFKHGISYQTKSFVSFELSIQEEVLNCVITNSKHNGIKPKFDEYAGIGLENIKKSLKLLYDDDYDLVISDKENEFVVNLTIKI
ncbi:MAG: histidine kinase [bacterium]